MKNVFPEKLIYCITIFFCQNCLAFINIEALRQVPGEGFVGSSSLQMNGQQGNTQKFSSKISTLGIFRFTRDEFLFLVDYRYGTSFNRNDTNRGQGHVRYTFFHREKIGVEVFFQSEYDEFKDTNSRHLAGSNLRFRLVEDGLHTLFLGTGVFYESEDFAGADDDTEIRGNMYVSYGYKANEVVLASVTAYFQPSLEIIEDHRVRLQSGLDVFIKKNLIMDVDFNLTHDTSLPSDVKPTDSDYLVGFTLTY